MACLGYHEDQGPGSAEQPRPPHGLCGAEHCCTHDDMQSPQAGKDSGLHFNSTYWGQCLWGQGHSTMVQAAVCCKKVRAHAPASAASMACRLRRPAAMAGPRPCAPARSPRSSARLLRMLRALRTRAECEPPGGASAAAAERGRPGGGGRQPTARHAIANTCPAALPAAPERHGSCGAHALQALNRSPPMRVVNIAGIWSARLLPGQRQGELSGQGEARP